jgi:thymidylate synthase
MRPVYIEATTLDDAWHQAVYNLFEYGYRYTIDQGSYQGSQRVEFDFVTIRIKRPFDEPRLPVMPEGLELPSPATKEFVEQYFQRYIMSNIKEPGEVYTYGSRLTNAEGVDQIEEVIRRYKTQGYNSNQLVLQVAHPSDLVLEDPPCLRHIDTRIRYEALHFFPYFRSWDLWSGFPANLAALQMLKEYMANEIGVEDGEMIVTSKGLHVYKHVEELAQMRFGKDFVKSSGG